MVGQNTVMQVRDFVAYDAGGKMVFEPALRRYLRTLLSQLAREAHTIYVLHCA